MEGVEGVTMLKEGLRRDKREAWMEGWVKVRKQRRRDR